MSNMFTHVINEQKSPPDALVWTMWCGHQCLAFEDGTTAPRTDLYAEHAADKADCEGCKKRFDQKDVKKTEVLESV